MKNNIKNIQDNEFYRKIFRLTWPSFVELFLSSLFTAIDLMMVGRLSPAAISGVGITNQPFFLLISVFAAVNVGSTALVAWNIGSGEPKSAAAVLKQTLIINGCLGAVLSVAGFFSAEFIMKLMSTNPDIVRHATEYFRIVSAGLVFQSINMGITACLRGCGLTSVPMVYNLCANFVNVMLNFVLIYGKFGFPRLEVTGAALATTISRLLGATAAFIFVITYKNSPVRLRISGGWKPDRKIMREIFRIGIPSALEQFVIQSGLLIFNRIVETLGVTAYAAQQVCVSINGLAFSVSNAFSISTTTLVGQSIGAGNTELAERYARMTSRMARIITFIIAVGFIFFWRLLAQIYTDDEAVIEFCRPIFYVVAVIQFIQSAQMSKTGALRGAGDTLYPLYASILGIWVFRVGMTALFIFVFKFSLLGAWFAFLIDQCMRSIVITLRFRSGKWKTVKNRRHNKNG
ncbi:MAG: MATE family efflux transporter [Clostridiales bacterium]|jgi:putative MATE family efflux protein|nr:MATE family efflux transporter [Clostridiales bacterium]